MLRYALDIAYRGTLYHGWQIQENAKSVQAELNNALEKLVGAPIETVGSGRTDTGVHAKQQIVHMDVSKEIDPILTKKKLNAILPIDISIKNIVKVDSSFHARFSAMSRTYEYYITSVKDPFLVDLAYYLYHPLDIEKMNKAASKLLLYDDFSSFCKSNSSVSHHLCKVTLAKWVQTNSIIQFQITANRFLRGMVRTIVGTLIKIGMNDIQISDFEEIIRNKNRQNAGVSAPACGLFLTEVKYPLELFKR